MISSYKSYLLLFRIVNLCQEFFSRTWLKCFINCVRCGYRLLLSVSIMDTDFPLS